MYRKILICGAIVFLALAGCQKKPAFNVQTVRVVGRVYYLANPLSDSSELLNYVQQNRAYFVQNGPAIKCAAALGKRFVSQAISSYSQSDYDRAYGRSLEMGATGEMARGVADSISSGSVDLLIMGEELIWLAEVLPYAANGNWGPFNNTGTQVRQAMRQYLIIMQTSGVMDPYMLQLVRSSTKQFEAIAEEQIVWLAIMSGLCK